MVSQMVLVNGFNRYEAAELTGVPYERFTYLDKIGKVKPAGRYGRLVLYSFEQILEVMASEMYERWVDISDISDKELILNIFKCQLKEKKFDKQIVFLQMKSINSRVDRIHYDYLDEKLSFKELLEALIAEIEFDADENPKDCIVQIHLLKSVKYFIEKMLINAKNSSRVTPDEFLARANLTNFMYQ